MKLFRIPFIILITIFISCSKKNVTTGTCSDGIKNQDETEIDCGGRCSKCPSCSDGIQNQGETGIDCGGPCGNCKLTFGKYGYHGRNILHNDTLTIKSVLNTSIVPIFYSVSADIPENYSLVVIITHQQVLSQGTIWYTTSSPLGWTWHPLDVNTLSNKMTVNFPCKSDMRIHFSGTGWAIIDLYENGASTPFLTKNISWKP